MNRNIAPKTWFEQWRGPREFFRRADECMGEFDPDAILGMPEAQHLFDAYVVGLFARIWNDYHACSVRLVRDTFPDAELRDNSGVLEIEATMADQKDRRMAQEHRLWREKARARGGGRTPN